MLEIKAKQEQFERLFQEVSNFVSYVEEFLRSIVFVTSQQQHPGEVDDDDTSNYN